MQNDCKWYKLHAFGEKDSKSFENGIKVTSRNAASEIYSVFI